MIKLVWECFLIENFSISNISNFVSENEHKITIFLKKTIEFHHLTFCFRKLELFERTYIYLRVGIDNSVIYIVVVLCGVNINILFNGMMKIEYRKWNYGENCSPCSRKKKFLVLFISDMYLISHIGSCYIAYNITLFILLLAEFTVFVILLLNYI